MMDLKDAEDGLAVWRESGSAVSSSFSFLHSYNCYESKDDMKLKHLVHACCAWHQSAFIGSVFLYIVASNSLRANGY